MPLTIIARNRSPDPLQEHLRQRKQVWNKACSEFIARLNAFKPHLISFKRGLNGRGDAKAGLPISNIKNPLPNEIGGYLGHVNSEFNELASTFDILVGEASGIMQEQIQYAGKRRKGNPHPQQQQAHAAADNQNNEDTLISEGSSSISRFWAHISSILSSDKAKHQRLSMLSLCTKLFQNTVDLEDAVLSKGLDNVPQVLTAYFLVQNNFQSLKEAAKKLAELTLTPSEPATKSNAITESAPSEVPKSIPPPRPISPATPIASDSSTEMSLEQLKKNVVQMSNEGLSEMDKRLFLDMYHRHRKETNENKKELIKDRLYEIYQELAKKMNKRSELLSDLEITKLANNYLSRLFKKYKHQLGKKEPSSAVRLEIYEYIRDSKIQVDRIMNLLEKRNMNSNDLKELIEKMSALEVLLGKMSSPLKLLNMLHKDKFYEKDTNMRRNPMMDPVGRYFTRQIRQDIDKPGW